MPAAPAVSVQMLYRVGARNEDVGRTGLTHYLEHMAFRASENFPDTELVSSIYAVGGEWHGYTWLDQTTYFETLPAEHLDLALRIEADRMVRLMIPAAEMEAERGAVLTEMHGYENDPATVLHDAVLAVSFLQHPYRNNTIGWESDVENISHDDLVEFYRRAYRPANAVLAVVGRVSAAGVFERVRELFGGVPGGEGIEPPPTVEPPQHGVRRIELSGARRAASTSRLPTTRRPSTIPTTPPFCSCSRCWRVVAASTSDRTSSVTRYCRRRGWRGITDDLVTWYPPQAAPYVFTIAGCIDVEASTTGLEARLQAAIDALVTQPPAEPGAGDGPPAAPRRARVRSRDDRGRGPPACLFRRSGCPRRPARMPGSAGRGHAGRHLAGGRRLPPARAAHHRVVSRRSGACRSPPRWGSGHAEDEVRRLGADCRWRRRHDLSVLAAEGRAAAGRSAGDLPVRPAFLRGLPPRARAGHAAETSMPPHPPTARSGAGHR